MYVSQAAHQQQRSHGLPHSTVSKIMAGFSDDPTDEGDLESERVMKDMDLAASHSKCRQTTFYRKQEPNTTYRNSNASYNATNYAPYLRSDAYEEAERMNIYYSWD